MNKILIAEHTSKIRAHIKSLVEEYEHEFHLNFDIQEAENGQEAIDIALKENLDIIFIDVDIAVVDAIAVTKEIKKRCCSTMMIIAVASVDTDPKIKEILDNGADDYVVQPIQSDIYFHRLKTYLSIVKAKRHKLKNDQKINVYTSDVFSRVTKFFITSENALAEFWEYFLSGFDQKYAFEHDVIRILYSIAEAQYSHNKNSEIYLEESVEYMYFSILNISNIPSVELEYYLKKCSKFSLNYKVENDIFSIQLLKVFSWLNDQNENKIDKTLEAEDSVELDNMQKKEHNSTTEHIYKSSQKELKVYDYLDDEDLNDLYDYSSQLNSLMLLAANGNLEVEDVNEMSVYLEKIATLLSTYSEVYLISTSLNSLASVMKTHSDVFTEKSAILAPLCKGFVNDMSSWIKMSFETGAPSEDFMNDTIAVNCQTISSILTMDDEAEENHDNLDDIFDF